MSNDILKETKVLDALEYTKNILKISSSIEEIISNSNEINECEKDEYKAE